MASSGMPVNLKILSETMPVPGIFDTPVLGAAVFHQSTFNHLLFENLSATVGLRLDYEKNKIDYNSSAAMNIQMYMAGNQWANRWNRQLSLQASWMMTMCSCYLNSL